MTLDPRVVKSGWHLLCAGLALVELTATTRQKETFRRCVLGGVIGYHVVAAVDDYWEGEENCQK